MDAFLYQVGTLFRAVLEGLGPLAAVGFLVGVAAIAVFGPILKRKVEAQIASEAAAGAAAQQREVGLLAQLSEARQVLYNHIEHLSTEMKEDRANTARVSAKQIEALNAITSMCKDGFDAQRAEHKEMDEKFNALRIEIAREGSA